MSTRLTAGTVERMCHIDVIYRQCNTGVTDKSKEVFRRNLPRLGQPQRVVLAYITRPTWQHLTYVVGDENQGLCLDGFSWGYSGEGPTGLKWLLEEISFPPDTIGAALNLSAHEEGVWELELGNEEITTVAHPGNEDQREAVVLPNRLLTRYGVLRSEVYEQFRPHIEQILDELDNMDLNPGELQIMSCAVAGALDCEIAARRVRQIGILQTRASSRARRETEC